MNNTTVKNNKRYSTPDISVSAYLLTRGYQLLGVEKHNGRGIFLFPSTVEEDVLKFLNGESTVEPYGFLAKIRLLKGSLG